MVDFEFMKLMLASLFVLTSASCLLACPSGTKVSADLDVKVDPKACHEDPTHAAALTARGALTDDLVSLLCSSIEGGASVHVEFPRRAWHDLLTQTEDGGAKSFPGK